MESEKQNNMYITKGKKVRKKVNGGKEWNGRILVAFPEAGLKGLLVVAGAPDNSKEIKKNHKEMQNEMQND